MIISYMPMNCQKQSKDYICQNPYDFDKNTGDIRFI